MAALLIKGEVMAQDHIDKFTHQADDVVVILPDGTLLDTDPVQRLLDRGRKVPDNWMKALKKTQDRDNE